MVGVHVSEGKSKLKVNWKPVAVVVVAVVVVSGFAVVGVVSRGNTPGWGTAVWTGDARATMADTTTKNNPEIENRIITRKYGTKQSEMKGIYQIKMLKRKR